MRKRPGVTAAVAAASLTLAGLSAITPVAAAAPGGSDRGNAPSSGRGLDKHDAQLLAAAKARGDRTVTVLVSTKSGAAGDVRQALQAMGATIRYRDDALGYLRAVVGVNDVKRAAGVAGIDAFDLDEVIARAPVHDAPQPTTNFEGDPTPPDADTPDDNPYMPTTDIGSPKFKADHPTYDGRGTTIAIIDTGVALDNPALQTTSTGERKIVDWVNANDPTDGANPDASWVSMATKVSGPTVSWPPGSSTPTLYNVGPGDFRFNRLVESRLAGELFDGDLNRDGDTTDRFAVAWRLSDDAILVDTDNDRDLTDETPMWDYKQLYQVGWFGHDDLATPLHETVPFVVQLDRQDKFVNIGIPDDAHGSHVAGIVAGNNIYGGVADGNAPGAKLVSVRVCLFNAGCTSHGMLEGMIYALKTMKADAANMSIGGLPYLNDGSSTRDAVYNKLIDQTGAQIFLSAGNEGPGINTVGDPADAAKAVAVGAEATPATWFYNYGTAPVADFANAVQTYSSRGPGENGSLKPQVVAPGSATSTVPMWWTDPHAVTETHYTLPVGLAMFNGTSMASPQGTGAAALLLSAAKANRMRVSPDQLRQSLFSTAQFLDNQQAVDQGYGLINVPNAWDLLRQNLVVEDITSSAPVCTPIWLLLGRTSGLGIHNRCADDAGGFHADEVQTANVVLLRTSGPAQAVRHTLTWVGDDHTFDSAAQVDLPLNRAVLVPVTVHPTSAGLHSALLKVDSPATAGVDYAMLNTVVVADEMATDHTWSDTGTVQRTSYQRFFVNVPPHTPNMLVNLSDFGDAKIRWQAFHPYGYSPDAGYEGTCYTNSDDSADCPATERVYAHPEPGVWEFTVEARRATPALDNPFTLTVSAVDVSISPPSTTIASAVAGTPTPASWQLTNNLAAFTVGSSGTDLSSAKQQRPTITAGGGVQEFTVTVPAGATELLARIRDSEPGVDLDLYVLKDGVMVDYDADEDANETVVITDPEPGTYTIQVDPYDIPDGSTDYDYLDAYTVAGLGSVSGDSAPAARAAGDTWTVDGSVTALQAPAAGRVLYGQFRAVTAGGTPISSADVVVQAVATP